eukprot:scaffold3591_cov124-Pinguiococcus_pyrenoidosus.AAC.1
MAARAAGLGVGAHKAELEVDGTLEGQCASETGSESMHGGIAVQGEAFRAGVDRTEDAQKSRGVQERIHASSYPPPFPPMHISHAAMRHDACCHSIPRGLRCKHADAHETLSTQATAPRFLRDQKVGCRFQKE